MVQQADQGCVREMMRYDHVERVQGMTTMIIENATSQVMLLSSS
ncbi:hypothetical protein F383_19607 [Gossypium arboreum]|uniref:Uncharacterized protein n=1 Tax=Gossypium arboreum TaxID=29729 RepID=A0A0B0NLE4_GOSAR|nr:hypothetical protein F383_19607 [Gossypium arboreum]